MNDVIALVFTILLCVMIVKWVSTSEAPTRPPPQQIKKKDNINYKQIDVIYKLKNKINRIENLILDIRTSDPDTLYRSVSIDIPDGSGEYSFLIDGENDVSTHLIQLLETEKEKLLEELDKEIEKLYTPPDEE